MSDKKKCPGITKAGKPCGGVVTGSGWCAWHDPAIPQETKIGWAKEGGKVTSYPMAVLLKNGELLQAEGMPDLKDPHFLDNIAARVQAGTMPVSIAEQLRRLHDSKREDRSLELAWRIFERLQDPATLALLVQAQKAQDDGD